MSALDDTEARVKKQTERARAAERKHRNTRKHLRDLAHRVDAFLLVFDALMKTPATVQRGHRVARLTNELDLQNQIAKRFGGIE